MKEALATRKRFHKPFHFLNKAGEHPLSRLTEIFQNIHLDDFRQEINLWQELALCSDQSAYDEGCTRGDLMDFIHGLQKMIEAFHIINEKNNQQKKNRQVKGLSKQTKKILSEINIPVLLTKEEKARPGSVIKHFCKTFKKTYAKIEMMDLLDAVITYEGNRKVYKGNLILFYQHVHYLICLAYKTDKNKKLPLQAKSFRPYSVSHESF